MFLTRRQFLKTTAGTIAAVAIADKALALTALQPVIEGGQSDRRVPAVHGSVFIIHTVTIVFQYRLRR